MSKEIEMQVQGLLSKGKYSAAMKKAATLPDGAIKKQYQSYFKLKDFSKESIASVAKNYKSLSTTNLLKLGLDIATELYPTK